MNPPRTSRWMKLAWLGIAALIATSHGTASAAGSRHRAAKPSAAAASIAPAAAAPTSYLPPPSATDVKVERVRPPKEKYLTLRFLKENRDFLRSRFDRLKETPDGHQGEAVAIDPRFLAYQRLLAEVRASADSLAAAEEERKRQELFSSVTDLGQLEAQLDLMDRLLTEQRTRLAALEEDFAGRQQTSLSIVVSGVPAGATVDSLALTREDGSRLSVMISADQREALRRGGVLQVFRGLVEPREQVVEVTIGGSVGLSSASGFITLEPTRDRLTFLRLDLSPVQAEQGASSMTASTWTLDTELHASNGSEPGP